MEQKAKYTAITLYSRAFDYLHEIIKAGSNVTAKPEEKPIVKQTVFPESFEPASEE